MKKRDIEILVGGGLVHGSIFSEIVSRRNLFRAWLEFRRGKRAKFEVQQFEARLEDNLFRLHSQLISGRYMPGGYASFFVHDPKLRHIHKAPVRDRVLHQAVFRILYPLFDKNFIYDSYSSRIGKGTHAGVNQVEQFLRKSSRNYTIHAYALKCDIRRFFDSVDHDILFQCVKKKINNSRAQELILKIIKSFSHVLGKGLPLGNVTSQLFANIYLNPLDQFLKRQLHAKYYARYCDDFIVISHNEEYLYSLIPKIQRFLKHRLFLDLHKNKVLVREHNHGIDFLGYVLRPHHRVLRAKTKKRMMNRITQNNLASYHGLPTHRAGHKLEQAILERLERDKIRL